jgi:osmotically-inducible protein OsmY
MHRGESGWERLDRDLERRVTNFISQQFSRLRTVEVEATEGVVTIHGQVGTFYERQLCIHCCQRVAGVTGLIDKVEVVQSPPARVKLTGYRPKIALAS